MATSARTWFYTTPEERPYLIEERVNHTLWNNRLQGVYMNCVQYTTPVKMVGNWNDMPLEFEWQPEQWFILRAGREVKELIGVMRQILMMRPALAYQDEYGMYCVEWHTDGGEDRWRHVQGKPEFQGLRRLRRN